MADKVCARGGDVVVGKPGQFYSARHGAGARCPQDLRGDVACWGLDEEVGEVGVEKLLLRALKDELALVCLLYTSDAADE